MKEDGDELCCSVIRYYAAVVETEINEGRFCAIGTDKDDGKQGYYLLKYTGADGTYTDQDTGKRMVQGIYWHDIDDDDNSDDDNDIDNNNYDTDDDDDNDDIETEPWFFPKKSKVDTVAVNQIVMGNIVMEAVNDENCPIKEVEEEYRGKQAMKVSEDSHDFILGEMVRREYLEYDPNRIYLDEVESKNDDVGRGENEELFTVDEKEEEEEEEEIFILVFALHNKYYVYIYIYIYI